jgi:DNA mismatch repair ATPase MutL
MQVECKFILAEACGVLMAVDQHAADERVRLEALRQQVAASDGSPLEVPTSNPNAQARAENPRSRCP